MKRISAVIIALILTTFLNVDAQARQLSEYQTLARVMDSARVLEADIFAPKTFAKALKKFIQAKQAMEAGKQDKTIIKRVREAREYVENALKASEVAKLSLQQYLSPREKAQKARASSMASELYTKAEAQFIKAAAKVESGDVKNGLKEAGKATPLFDIAELEALKSAILSEPDKLIAKAEADDAKKYAPSTLDKAHSARTKADLILTNDRYAHDEAQAEAEIASYEARHASNIGLSVRSLNRNDQAWEKLMLIYEIQMNRVGKAVELSHLPFDNGPFAAADTLIDYIKDLQAYSQNIKGEAADLSGTLVENLRNTLEEIGESTSKKDPVELTNLVGAAAIRFYTENGELERQLQDKEAQFVALTAVHDDVQAQLQVREDRESKLLAAKKLLTPSEGEVLFNSSNDIVLRLSGVSFDIGKTDIKDEHIPLLEKVKQIIEMFPDAKLVIEGHTDASGDNSANMLLSEKRAFAVMQYIRQSLMLPSDRIRSMGFGSERPIASNQTPEGRSKNRRIDVLIMR